MKKQGYVVLVLIGILLSSCISTIEKPFLEQNVPENHANATAGQNQSELMIQRGPDLWSTCHFYIYVDGQIAGDIKSGSAKIIIPNGTHNISGRILDLQSESLMIDANSKRYAIKSEFNKGLRFIVQNETELPGAPKSGVEGALARAAEQTLQNVPTKSRIAIVYITAQDRSTTDYIVGELEYIWVNAGYFITDRSQLDRLRKEQNFGMSGEVDDKTAAAIGKIAGASIIVTGRVDGEGNLRRLRLRALDTQTAQVVGVASERL